MSMLYLHYIYTIFILHLLCCEKWNVQTIHNTQAKQVSIGQCGGDDGWWCSWSGAVSGGRRWSMNKLLCGASTNSWSNHNADESPQCTREFMKVDCRKVPQWVETQWRSSYTNCTINDHMYHWGTGLAQRSWYAVQVVGVQRSQGSSLVECDWVQSCPSWSSWHETWSNDRRCRPAGSGNHALKII